eukprot:jgi/Botrbrau1/4643/Bobra.33_2s0014.1
MTQVPVFVPTRFQWMFGGQSVHLCGSFTRWVETVPMHPIPGEPGKFQVVVHLPPGYHQYKFIVDGEWRHDESQPFMPDPLGNVNNWLFVRRSNDSNSSAQQPPPHQSAVPSTLLIGSSAPVQGNLTALPPPDTPLAPPLPAGIPIVQLPPPGQLPVHLVAEPLVPGVPDEDAAIDVDITMTDANVPQPGVLVAATQVEPEFTRMKIRDFLHSHTVYELIPESGKVVLLDVDLPIRQAFHALYEQNIASSPLWDSSSCNIIGMISASDFIHILRRLHSNVASGHNVLTEAEMDLYTLRQLRQGEDLDVCPPRPLVFLHTDNQLSDAIASMFEMRCSMAPILTVTEQEGVMLLGIATISSVLATLMRHFRTATSQLPLLLSPISALPLGTWSPESNLVRHEQAAGTFHEAGVERRSKRKIRPLICVFADDPLMKALDLLLTENVSALPVVDSHGVLQNMYARADITHLAKNNAYTRLQWEHLSVGQTLSLLSIQSQEGNPSENNVPSPAPASAIPLQRCHTCTANEPLRSVVERLSVPGVRRLFIIDPDTRRLEGVISLSDVAAFLCDV